MTGTSAASTTADKNVFHWRLYFRIEQRSVLFDLTPGGDGQTGVLMVTSKSTTGTTARVAVTYPVAPTARVTVQQYLDFFIDKRLDKFKYDSTGSGCRWWCTVALQELEAAGLVVAGSANTFLAWVDKQAAARPANIAMPVRKGTFY